MRVHELAKELGISSKELLAKLREMGVEAKSHMSALTDEAVGEARRGSPAPDAEPTAETEPVAEAEAPAEGAEVPPERGSAPAAPPDAEPEDVEEAPALEEPATAATGSSAAIRIRGAVVVKELAEKLDIRPNQLVAQLMQMNVFASINERIEFVVAKKIAAKFGVELIHEKKATEHKLAAMKRAEEPEEDEDRPEDLLPRPPVVTFLGHVDHGKTSLLDKIRDTAVVDGEFGGITQHIGAYQVEVGGRRITFLDTPGHAAFTAMRARGANLTDIAVIIIAADDGIMPQTKEAIQHARAADVALIVAINKMDLPAANADTVRQQLQAEGLAPEDWGGEVICCEVSAETGDGIDHLLEMILLQADMLELRANPTRRAKGYVIEARMEPGMGPTANLLVTKGTLQIGDAVLCGENWGRVRALISDHGVQLKSAAPATPVKCLGLSGIPEAGAMFRTCAKEKTARALAQEAGTSRKQDQLQAPKKASLESLFEHLQEDDKLDLRLVLKADTQGSVEAITHALEEIRSDKISLNIVLQGTGNISGNDVMLASASAAVIMGFHVAKEAGVDAQSKHEGIEIRLHSVIYELIDEVRDAMTGLLTPELREKIQGVAEVRQVFPIGKVGTVAGCLMVQGTVTPRNRARVKRGEEVLFEGKIASLKHFQEDASEIREAQECGVRLESFADFEENDILEFYEIEEVEQTL